MSGTTSTEGSLPTEPEGAAPSATRVDLEGPLDESILFDQYSRYASCAEHLDAAMSPGATVLDVGCGPFRLLGKFLPTVEVTYLDPLLSEDQGELVLSGTLERLARDSRRWDWVVAVDTLEHIPPGERDEFLETLLSLAREGVVLAGPYREDAAALAVDDLVNEAYREKTGSDYSWLREHIEYGLPSLDETRARLAAHGLQHATGGNGHAPWLEELLPLTVAHLDRSEHAEVMRSLSMRFNLELYAFDALEPVYRRLLVGKRGELPRLPRAAREGPAERDRARELWRRFRAGGQALLGAHADALAERAEDCDGRLAVLEPRVTVAERDARQYREQLGGALATLASYEASISWRITRPLRWLNYKLRPALSRLRSGVGRLLEGSTRGLYHALPLGKQARYRAKQAFFALFGWWLRGTAAHRNYVAERRIRSEREAGRMIGGQGVELPAARPERPDVVVWGVIDWHFRIQRPQHLARELARAGHRVFYVSPCIAGDEQPGFCVQSLDEELALYHLELRAAHAPSIYAGVPAGDARAQLEAAVRKFLHWSRPLETWSILEHPGWLPLATLPPNQRLVYDWMDNHQGFSNTARSLEVAEAELLRRADLTLASSEWLRCEAAAHTDSLCLLRNAGEFEHFNPSPEEALDLAGGRRVIGYYGAIAEWFDVELVRSVARRFPEALVLLVGADTAEVAEQLASQPNVSFVGEVAYEELPRYLHAMDVCLIPFVVNELTRATNPVKVYEYLAAGRPVVTTGLPEIRDAGLDELVARCEDRESFLAAVQLALSEDPRGEQRRPRIERSRRETWSARCAVLREAIEQLDDPMVSVIVVTWNNLDLTRACLASLFADPARPRLEVIVVDNGSSDGTPAWLREQAERESRLKLVLNEDNRGFAAANNQGLELASGEYLVLLNNDTVVTRGWLRGLVAHFGADPQLGLLGPITNNIGNEAKVPTSYETPEEMHREAASLVIDGAGKSFELPVVAFFCVMFTRAVYEEVGTLDEGFGMGFFEDDDYCRRVRASGRTIRCTEAVFIHHELSASFDKIDPAQRAELFERNKRYYESKWGTWVPHNYRTRAPAAEPLEAH